MAGSAGGGTPGTGTGTRSTGRETSLVNMQDLLRQRAEAGLEALELGPLIGRGSFGRVYKGEGLRPFSTHMRHRAARRAGCWERRGAVILGFGVPGVARLGALQLCH